MALLMTDEFAAALDEYPPDMRQVVLGKMRLLQENPYHPSLKAHKLHNTDGKWDCYVTTGDRIIYDWDDGDLRLWKLGPHKIIDRVRHASFAPHTAFRRPGWDEEPAPVAAALEVYEWQKAEAPTGTGNPFAEFPATYLRLLGVPAGLVRAVQEAPTADSLQAIDGLSELTLNWMLELLTNKAFESVLFDPGRLLFRTTLDHLEGYCQGAIRQLMLNLTAEQRKYTDLAQFSPGITVLKGVAGSGKTTVGIYRAIALAGEGRRVLLLTYNRTLCAATRSLIESLIGDLPGNLQVMTVDGWIAGFLASRGAGLQPLDDGACMAHLKEALAEARTAGTEAVLELRSEFFRDEIGRVIKGTGLRTQQQYLAVERHGRKSALAPEQRRAVWRVYEGYERRLAEAGACDWRDPALRAYDLLVTAPLDKPYDDVIVDEGQDLTAIQLRIAQRLTRSGESTAGRSLLILGDAAQTIYSRGFSWRQAGIPATGRTFALRRNHRNTRQIAEAAAQLLEHNHIMRTGGDYVDPEWTQRAGPWPLVIACDRPDIELRAVRERILDLVSDQRFRVSDFAVLCPTVELCEQVRNNLTAALLPCALHWDEEFDLLEEQVKILTIHSAKGLEFPVIFVVGVREGLMPRRPPMRLDDEERTLEMERQRTLLYVAMTRAAEALFLVTTANARSDFLGELGAQVRTEAFRKAAMGG